jgi:NitT/TauT family transport system substrate-binding protein
MRSATRHRPHEDTVIPFCRLLLVLCAVVIGLAPAAAGAADTLRLEWIVQGQFAGELVALDKGYYKAAGADIKLLPAGSDIKPAVTVAQGSDAFGIGHPNQVIVARSHGAPLVMVTQYGQKSAQVYIARKSSGIRRLEDVRGKRIGSWFGGDEAEFLAMLHAVHITPADVHLVAQQENPIAELIDGQLDVIESTRYAPGDMKPLYNVFRKDQLTYLYPETYHTAMINTGLFTSEKTIAQRPQLVQAVVDATLRGWQEALRDPRAAAKIVVKYNPELNVDDQVAMIEAMGDMFCAGPTLAGNFGEATRPSWNDVQRILLLDGKDDADGLQTPIDLSAAYTNTFWAKAPAAYKRIACPK